jgi:hypothetical protein
MGKLSRNFAAVTRVGLDLAKNAFQVHAVDAKGQIVVALKLTRGRLVPFGLRADYGDMIQIADYRDSGLWGHDTNCIISRSGYAGPWLVFPASPSPARPIT